MLGGSWVAMACVAAASVVVVIALTSALWGTPKSGYYGDEEGLVLDVFPGSPIWRLGVRAGMPVVSVDPGELPAEWQVVIDMGVPVAFTQRRMTQGLRDTAPVAVVAVVVAALAALVVAFGASGAVALAAAAIALSEQPMMATGVPANSSAAVALALMAPALWFAGRSGHHRWGVLLLIASSVLGAAWIASRFALPTWFEPLEALRVVVTYATLIALILVAGGREVSAVAGGYDRRRRTDVAVLVVTIIVCAVLIDRGTPIVQTLVVGLMVLLAYPIVRGRLWLVMDRLGLGEMRQRATVQATEDERARVAREIHDTAIQDLAAMASSIERSAGSDAATAAQVRVIADRLRAITNELRSPELEDLGLGGALSALVAREDRADGMRVRLNLSDSTSPADRREVPDDVALAFFRIAKEAIGNALRHSGGSEVRVTAAIGADLVELVITDDGVGLDQVALESAARLGHMGLASMRQRASLVGATFSIGPGGPGVRIHASWTR